jgi:hypothetical protein
MVAETFLGLLLAAAPQEANCADSRHRALDFWLGSWTVTTASGERAGESSVVSVLDGCAVLERWGDVRGESGLGLHRFDRALGRWRQTWLDDRGRSMELEGDPEEGCMRWSQEDPSGAIERGEIRRLGEDRLEQKASRSVDGGKTWTPLFHLVYHRVNDPDGAADRDQ